MAESDSVKAAGVDQKLGRFGATEHVSCGDWVEELRGPTNCRVAAWKRALARLSFANHVPLQRNVKILSSGLHMFLNDDWPR